MIPARANRVQLGAVVLGLVVLQFYLRPRLGDSRATPDFTFVALMLFAMRSGPGASALFGFVIWVGLLISWLFFAGLKPPLAS